MQKLLEKIYRFLALRPRSRKEVVDYLKRKKAADSEKILNFLEERNLLNDFAFAEWWVEQRTAFRPKGKIALRVELKQKGISEEIINQTLEKIDEVALAKQALKKKINLDKQKLVTFLSYRGFSRETIKKILKSFTCEKTGKVLK